LYFQDKVFCVNSLNNAFKTLFNKTLKVFYVINDITTKQLMQINNFLYIILTIFFYQKTQLIY